MKKLYKPAKDLKVRDMQTGGFFPPDGAVRMETTYLTRRVREGSLISQPVKVVIFEESKALGKGKSKDKGN